MSIRRFHAWFSILVAGATFAACTPPPELGAGAPAANVSTVKELIAALNAVAPEHPRDFLAALAQHGYVLTPELKARLDAELAKHPPRRGPRAVARPDAESAQLYGLTTDKAAATAVVSSSSSVTTIGTAQPIAPVAELALAAGDYDFKVALTLAQLSQLLAGLKDTAIWPSSVNVPDLGSYTIPALRGILDGIPAASEAGDMRLGSLRFTAAPTVVRDAGTQWPILRQPFALDFLPPAGGTQPAVSLTGTLRAGVGIATQVLGRQLTISVGKIPQSTLNAAEQLQIEVASSSVVKFHTAQDQNALAIVLGNWLQGWLATNQPSFTLGNPIELPIDISPQNPSLFVQGIDVTTASAAGAGDALVIGGRLLPPAHGNLANLENPFTDLDGNLSLHLHESFFQRAAQAAFSSGTLQAVVDEQQGTEQQYVIKSAGAELQPGKIVVHLSGYVHDYCDILGGDLGADVDLVESVSLANGQITIQSDSSQSIDLSYGDDWCAVSAVITGVFDWLYDHSIDYIVDAIAGSEDTDDGPTIFDATIGSGHTIPSTELKLNVIARSLAITDDAADVRWHATLPHDDASTFIFARFLRKSQFFPVTTSPLPGAAITLFDQDAPAPSGDDVTLPSSGTYTAPTVDQQLATGTTDSSGLVRIRLSQLATTAGRATIGSGLFRLTVPVSEARPDLYFKVDPTSGYTRDTKALANGFWLNASGNHLGTATSPLVITLPADPLVLQAN